MKKRRIVLNGRRMRTREEMYRYLKRKLSLPAGCGKNLDALHDVCTEPRFALDVVLTRRDLLLKNLGEYGESFIVMMTDCADENDNMTFIEE